MSGGMTENILMVIENIGSVIKQVNWFPMKKLMPVVDVECTFVESKLIFQSRFKLHQIGDTPNGILLMTFLFQMISMVRLFVVNQCSIIRHEKTVVIQKTDVAILHVDVGRRTASQTVNVSMEIIK